MKFGIFMAVSNANKFGINDLTLSYFDDLQQPWNMSKILILRIHFKFQLAIVMKINFTVDGKVF